MRARQFFYASLAAAGLGIGLVPILAAQDDQKKGPNATHEKPRGAEAKHEGPQGVEPVAMAHALAKYGRKNHDPMALITAARILSGAGSQPMDAKPETKADEKPDGAAGGQQDTRRPPDEPASLLAEARQMAAGNTLLSSLADQVASTLKEVQRGRLPGPFVGRGSVPAYSTQTIVWTFEGGEPAAVAISGDGDTDFDLYVYDENGNLIDSDTDNSDDCVVRWRPRWTGKFIIRIKNRGQVYNEYAIVTN
jgi:hypothetical protein